MPKSITEEKYVQQYYECVLKLHNEGFFKWDPKKIVCIDCCTNSRRLEREKTISMRGAKPKKFSAAKAIYTNTYMVALCLEDEGQYPALMFTHDPAFDSNGPRAAEVQKWFDEMGIERDRVIYTAGGKKYNYESSAMVAHFKNVYREELAGTRVIHDGGKASKLMVSSFLLMERIDSKSCRPRRMGSCLHWTTRLTRLPRTSGEQSALEMIFRNKICICCGALTGPNRLQLRVAGPRTLCWI
jgi:hypothetical protein